jgi:hypothetical protein
MPGGETAALARELAHSFGVDAFGASGVEAGRAGKQLVSKAASCVISPTVPAAPDTNDRARPGRWRRPARAVAGERRGAIAGRPSPEPSASPTSWWRRSPKASVVMGGASVLLEVDAGRGQASIGAVGTTVGTV